MANDSEYREVDYHIYCEKCKHYEDKGYESVCEECLDTPINLYQLNMKKSKRKGEMKCGDVYVLMDLHHKRFLT